MWILVELTLYFRIHQVCYLWYMLFEFYLGTYFRLNSKNSFRCHTTFDLGFFGKGKKIFFVLFVVNCLMICYTLFTYFLYTAYLIRIFTALETTMHFQISILLLLFQLVTSHSVITDLSFDDLWRPISLNIHMYTLPLTRWV